MTINGLPTSFPPIVPRPVGPGQSVRTSESLSLAVGAPHQATVRGASLWDVLTQEEKSFFLGSAAGGLSYNPLGQPDKAEPVVGQHLDVRA